MGDDPFGSCPQNPPLNTSKRSEFGRWGCTVYSYPSAGGILIKEADIVDMRFLHLDRFTAASRSADPVDEDNFCKRMRMLGATWWADEQEWIDVQLGLQDRTELQERRLVFGWPMSGHGVWVLRYESENALPKDFGKVTLAVDMDERSRVMREYGATFYDDPGRVEELKGWL